MLIESIPKEPLSFHVIPFDCPRVQYTVQASSLSGSLSVYTVYCLFVFNLFYFILFFLFVYLVYWQFVTR